MTTPTREQVVQWAKESGCVIYSQVEDQIIAVLTSFAHQARADLEEVNANLEFEVTEIKKLTFKLSADKDNLEATIAEQYGPDKIAIQKQAWVESDKLRQINDLRQQNAELTEVIESNRQLVRDLDVMMNGEEGAAQQASLCDLVAQFPAWFSELTAQRRRGDENPEEVERMLRSTAKGRKKMNIVYQGHHIWCNYSAAGPAAECKMCKRFNELYPMDGMSGAELSAKHFPDAVLKTEPNAPAITGD